MRLWRSVPGTLTIEAPSEVAVPIGSDDDYPPAVALADQQFLMDGKVEGAS